MQINILAFNKDVLDGSFKLAITQEKWGIVDDSDERPTWPFILIWVAAAERENSPNRYYFRFELDNYPSQAPNICIWDYKNNKPLVGTDRPKGVEDAAILFRSDAWEQGLHLYAPYERKALATHPDWLRTYPNMCWKPTDSIIKALENIHETLNSSQYHGK